MLLDSLQPQLISSGSLVLWRRSRTILCCTTTIFRTSTSFERSATLVVRTIRSSLLGVLLQPASVFSGTVQRGLPSIDLRYHGERIRNRRYTVSIEVLELD